MHANDILRNEEHEARSMHNEQRIYVYIPGGCMPETKKKRRHQSTI